MHQCKLAFRFNNPCKSKSTGHCAARLHLMTERNWRRNWCCKLDDAPTNSEKMNPVANAEIYIVYVATAYWLDRTGTRTRWTDKGNNWIWFTRQLVNQQVHASKPDMDQTSKIVFARSLQQTVESALRSTFESITSQYRSWRAQRGALNRVPDCCWRVGYREAYTLEIKFFTSSLD